ncbi:MAG: DUF4290 domain-containing protein [Prevotella sp.]|nr:DUF4290 domain-containing protein [Prevotella sp.]
MNIEGLDYNTSRTRLVLPEYGREVQQMVEYAKTLPTKEERQRCAEEIVKIMNRMFPHNRDDVNYRQKLWDHLAIMSNFELDIDYPYNVSEARSMSKKPQPLGYPMNTIPMRHYGSLVFELFEQLKTMPAGEARDELVRQTANQMKRDLLLWSHANNVEERIAGDLARFTDGAIQIDLATFRFEKINERELLAQKMGGKRKK